MAELFEDRLRGGLIELIDSVPRGFPRWASSPAAERVGADGVDGFRRGRETWSATRGPLAVRRLVVVLATLGLLLALVAWAIVAGSRLADRPEARHGPAVVEITDPVHDVAPVDAGWLGRPTLAPTTTLPPAVASIDISRVVAEIDDAGALWVRVTLEGAAPVGYETSLIVTIAQDPNPKDRLPEVRIVCPPGQACSGDAGYFFYKVPFTFEITPGATDRTVSFRIPLRGIAEATGVPALTQPYLMRVLISASEPAGDGRWEDTAPADRDFVLDPRAFDWLREGSPSP